MIDLLGLPSQQTSKMKYNTSPKESSHLLPQWNELIDINLNLPAQKLNDSMGIIFKVIDQNIKETVGESYLVPIKKFMTAEYSNLTIELYHETRLAGKVYIETSFKVFKIFSEPKPQKLYFS